MLAVVGDRHPGTHRVTVPGGVWPVDSVAAPVREFTIRPVDGGDEAFLLDLTGAAPPSERASALLARCLLGGEAVVRSLTVGDREALLLHLRRLTLGDSLECVLPCPSEACGKQMDLTLRASDLLVPPYDDVRREYDVAVCLDGTRYEVTFRLPTTTDLDRSAVLARSDPERAALELLRHCVSRVARDEIPMDVEGMPAEVRSAVASAMAERDPQAELELDLRCPDCGVAFSVVFDAGTFILQEIDRRAARLLREVHLLAWHYHWSEQDILQLPASRRARYLELVTDAVSSAREG